MHETAQPGLPRLSRLYLWLRAFADRRRARHADAPGALPAHLQAGERGEDLAFWHLRSLGHTLVARRWRSARLRGDLDLIGWDGDTLVFFEVKTRTGEDFAPAASAVDEAKQKMLRRMARAYRARLPEAWRAATPVRFDVVSVYDLPAGVRFEVIRNAFPPGIQSTLG